MRLGAARFEKLKCGFRAAKRRSHKVEEEEAKMIEVIVIIVLLLGSVYVIISPTIHNDE